MRNIVPIWRGGRWRTRNARPYEQRARKVNVTDAVIDSEDKLAELTLAGKFKEGDIVAVDIADKEVVFN